MGDGEYSWNIPTNIFALNCGYFLGNITSREGTPDHFPDRGEMFSDMQNSIEEMFKFYPMLTLKN